MCVVSFVSDFYNDRNWPNGPYNPQKPFKWPQAAPHELPWTPETMQLMKEIMEKMKLLDSKLGLKDCEDPKKAEWMRSIEDRIAKLERQP